MSEKSKLTMLILGIIVIVMLIVVFALVDVNILGIKTLSISGIKRKADLANSLNLSFEQTQAKYNQMIIERTMAEKEYEKQKTKYATISDETISLIKDVTKDQKYMIEYLWIVLGDYAEDNNLKLVVMEPNQMATFNIESGQVAVKEAKQTGIASVTTPTGQKTSTSGNQTNTTEKIIISPVTNSNTVKILLIGEYEDITDFVFEVENDKNLKFKLDNMSMQYAGNNYVLSQFDVLGMSVLLK